MEDEGPGGVHPIYLMSAFGMKALLSCSSSALISSNFSISIELVLIPCARIPYVGNLLLRSCILLDSYRCGLYCFYRCLQVALDSCDGLHDSSDVWGVLELHNEDAHGRDHGLDYRRRHIKMKIAIFRRKKITSMISSQFDLYGME